MIALFAALIGVALGLTVLFVGGLGVTAAMARERPTMLGWWSLVLGAAAALNFVVGSGVFAVLVIEPLGWLLGSIVFASAAVVVAIGTLRRGDRHWPSWTGLVLGGIPALMWVVFVVTAIMWVEP